jgi:pimeloyl-ACP methyl ester carboxylesterase
MRHGVLLAVVFFFGCDSTNGGAPSRQNMDVDGGGKTTDDAAVGSADDLAAPEAEPDDLAPAAMTAPPDGAQADALRLPAATYTYRLDAGAFPPTAAHPSALVYIPSGFDPTPPLSFIVYIHGFYNCVENIVRDAGISCDPAAGSPVRTASALASQMEVAHKNAILLCPEVAYDQASGATGNLGNTNGFRALLAETLGDLAPVLGPRTLVDVGKVVLVSHSGGYTVAAAIATKGGVPVQELFLLDSIYGNVADFETWINQDRAAYQTTARRWASIYTAGGSTQTNSIAMAGWAKTWAPPDAGEIVDDRTTATWPDATYHHGLLFKLTGIAHGVIPNYYFSRLIESSSVLPDRPAAP